LKQGCCGIGDACDARAVAAKLGIPFYSVNFQAEFARIIDYFVDEYARGRTPNPCVVCNTELKFGRLLRYADMLDAEFVATGHYARTLSDRVVRWEGDKGGPPAGAPSVPVPDGDRSPPFCLARSLNRAKDQSYVLFGIRRADLSRCLFPLGDIADKADVRRIAADLELPVHDKPESQEICFVPDNDYARLVRQRRPETQRPGEIRDPAGRVLGTHDGVANYTIGQRRGLGVAARTPIYVTRLDAATNTVVVGPRAELLSGGLIAERVNWLVDPPPADEWQRAAIQIRYHHAAAAGAIRVGGLSEPRALASAERSTGQERRHMAGDRLETSPTPSVGVQSTADTAVARGTGIVEVRFDEPQSAVTPGQAAVFYDGDIVLGGGWIAQGIPIGG
jgi:tRNA-specific 2-thiouridylase